MNCPLPLLPPLPSPSEIETRRPVVPVPERRKGPEKSAKRRRVHRYRSLKLWWEMFNVLGR